jgi:NADH dehydrogenase [ubiquinone] 1 alpha subcomplex assembly factor 7
MTIADELATLIHREGPVPFDVFMEAALYAEGGFFASGHGAGRAGRDFVTSPETGSLFGLCVARALDELWRALDEPDPFLVIEAGAGNGRLARDVQRAEPECAAALRYVLVERSESLRAEQRARLPIEPPDEALGPFVRAGEDDRPVPAPGVGPVFASVDALPPIDASDVVVIANELLDNLPFGIAERVDDGWNEIRIGHDESGFHEVLVPATEDLRLRVPAGTRAPIPRGIAKWCREVDATIHRGYVLAIDYVVPVAELAVRPWLRTYRAQQRGADPLLDPGSQDITADVVLEQLEAAMPFPLLDARTQADWLALHGIDDLVAEGTRIWDEGAHRGDLAALAGRSRVNEARALTDPAGLGAHQVLCFGKGIKSRP